MIKRLYNWVLSWSESKWGWLALFFIALFEASWFPLPPDVLLIALCIGATKKSFRFASICLVGSVLGAMIGYFIGQTLWGTMSDPSALATFCYEYIFSQQTFIEVSDYYEKYNFWIVFTAGFTPLPFKVFTIAGGMSHINFPMFVFASTISRGLRFFLVAWLIWKFGAPIKKFIDKYFNLLATLLTVVLIGISASLIGIFGGDEESSKKAATNNLPAAEHYDTTQNSNTETSCDTLDYSDAR
jgi:membrane protein YqaA with SNARE-associated domain